MFGSNGHYGHRWILNRYAGVAEGTPIPGLVEHGWNYNLGATRSDILLPFPDPFYVWSARNLRECRKNGLDHVVPLGAPFLYLPPLDTPVKTEPGSLLVMPLHGWERAQIEHDFEAYARKLGEIERRFTTITVCLYWFEYEQERYRKPFEARGHRVLTAGRRDENPAFLYDLRRLLLSHEYVSSNRVQTSTFYSLYLGRKFFVYGPPSGIEQHIDPSGKLYQAWEREEYPRLIWENFQDDTNENLGAEELGLEFVRAKEELRDLFLWRPDQRRRLDAYVRANRERTRRRAREERASARQKALATLPWIGRYFRR